ncbi:GntP family permease [Mycobacterium sp. URHB0021]
MSHLALVVNTAIAILAVVLLIVRFKFNPVVSLVTGSAYLGLATGIGVEKTIDAIMKGFGDIMAEIGLLIAFGVLMGSILQRTGAIQRLVETLLKVFGAKRMPYAMSLTIATFLQSIYVDVLLVISAPLARSMATKIGKKGTGRMAVAMAIGLDCGLALTVPGVGALGLAGLLGVPLGKMLLFGVLLVIPTVAIAVTIMQFVFMRGWWNEDRDEQAYSGSEADTELGGEPAGASPASNGSGDSGASGVDGGASGGVTTKTAATQTRTRAPLLLLFAPLISSLVLVAVGAILDAADIHNPIVKFVSSPVIALLIGLVGTSFVGRYAVGAEAVQRAIGTGFKESGQILILTGVGGSLAATIKATGLGDVLGEYFTASTVAPLLVVWAIAAALHIAIGSISISAITAAGILAPVAPHIGVDPVLLALAAGAGSFFCVHVTSNTFWMLQSLLGQSTRGALKTVTVGVSVASVVAILLILPMSALF